MLQSRRTTKMGRDDVRIEQVRHSADLAIWPPLAVADDLVEVVEVVGREMGQRTGARLDPLTPSLRLARPTDHDLDPLAVLQARVDREFDCLPMDHAFHHLGHGDPPFLMETSPW